MARLLFDDFDDPGRLFHDLDDVGVGDRSEAGGSGDREGGREKEAEKRMRNLASHGGHCPFDGFEEGTCIASAQEPSRSDAPLDDTPIRASPLAKTGA